MSERRIEYFIFKVVAAVLCSSCAISLSGQDLVINEWMSANQSTISDMDGKEPDWIEFYNRGTATLNLEGIGLSDEMGAPFKWTFPNVELESKAFLVIFASGNDITIGDELHTNFKLKAEGEVVYLTAQDGTLLDQTDLIALADDQSYGRFPDGSEDQMLLSMPSPGNSNNQGSDISIEHPSGFYPDEFQQKIYSSTGDEIRFTLDGSLPTAADFLYEDFITVNQSLAREAYLHRIPTSTTQDLLSYHAWQERELPLPKAITLRCAAFRNGERVSPYLSQVYFMGSQYDFSLPVLSLITEEDNLFDEETGIYVPGIHYTSDNPEWSGNFFEKGREWERDAFISYFDEDRDLAFEQEVGIRIHGGKTRQTAQKSLRVYARRQYGKNSIDYSLFPQKETNRYKTFTVRTTMAAWNHESIINDIVAHEIVSELNFDTQDYQPVIVFINGEYWGIQSLRDRYDEDYVASTYGVDADSLEMVTWESAHYGAMLNYMIDNDITEDIHYEHVSRQLDIDNTIDYYIAEMFFANYDWPANNFGAWRTVAPDSKWRWMFFDIDGGFIEPERNMFEHCTANDPNITWPNNPYSTFLFRNLIKNEGFKQEFVNRYAEHLNTTFGRERMRRILNEVKQKYAPEINLHSERWNYPSSFSFWEEQLKKSVAEFLNERPCIIEKQIKEFFGLEHFGFTCNETYSEVLEESIEVQPNPNSGLFTLKNKTENTISGVLSLHTLKGQTISHTREFAIGGKDNLEMVFSDLAVGVYLLQIRSGSNYITKKIVID